MNQFIANHGLTIMTVASVFLVIEVLRCWTQIYFLNQDTVSLREMLLDYAGGRESEWGDRAEECFRILETAVSRKPIQPSPPPDPDEWVVQDRVPVRQDLDRISWHGNSAACCIRPEVGGPSTGKKHGDPYPDQHPVNRHLKLYVMCRRRDLPKVEQKTLVELCADKTPTADISILGGPHDVCVMPTAEDLPKVEQPEQWPKYYTTGVFAGDVQFVRHDVDNRMWCVASDGAETLAHGWMQELPTWSVRAEVERGTIKQLTEAEAMALLKKPEPQPQKKRVRLWSCDTDGVIVAEDNCPAPGWTEIHHDAEGFYTID